MDSLDTHIIEENSPVGSCLLVDESSQLDPLSNPSPSPVSSLATEVDQLTSAKSDKQDDIRWHKFIIRNFSFNEKALIDGDVCPNKGADSKGEISMGYVLKQFEETDKDYKRNLNLIKMTGLAINGVILGTAFCVCPVQSLTYFGLKMIENAEWYSFAKEKRDLLSWQLSLHDVAETVSWSALVFCGSSHFYKMLVAPLQLKVFKIPVDIVTTTFTSTTIRPENYMEFVRFSLNEAGNIYKFVSDVLAEGMTEEVLRRMSANATIEFDYLMDHQVGLIQYFASGVEEISDNIFDIANSNVAGSAASFVKMQFIKKGISTALKTLVLAGDDYAKSNLTVEKSGNYSMQAVEKTLSNLLCKKILFKEFKTNYWHSLRALLCGTMFKAAFDLAINKTNAGSLVIEYIPFEASYNFTITVIKGTSYNNQDVIQLKP